MSQRTSLAKSLLHPIDRAIRWTARPTRDWWSNRRHAASAERILLVRHRVHIASYYRRFLEWIEAEVPDVRSVFELRTLPCDRAIGPQHRLIVPWVSENLVSRTARVYHQLRVLEAAAKSRGIPTINPVDAILQALKLEASEAISAAGVRTPKMWRIADFRKFRRDLDGHAPPLLVRENRAHGGSTKSYLIHSAAEAQRVPLERFEDPIAVEFIDVRSPGDGYFRKYRYLAAGNRGVAMSVQIAPEWEVRGSKRDLTTATRREEMNHQRQTDPNHDRLQSVRRQLGLDVVAFDYSYTPAGELVVWEINVLPGLALERHAEREYINYGVRRGMAAVVQLYLEKAGLEVPDSVHRIVAEGTPESSPARRVA